MLSQGNPFMGVSAPPQAGGAPKIVILKAPPAAGGPPLAPIAAPPQNPATPPGGANGGKVTFAKVLTAPPLRPGVSIVPTAPGSGGGTPGGTPTPGTVQRLVTPGRPVKQLVLQPVKAGGAGTPLKPAVTLTSAPAQVRMGGRGGGNGVLGGGCGGFGFGGVVGLLGLGGVVGMGVVGL